MQNKLAFILVLLAFEAIGQTPLPEMSSREKIFGNDFRSNTSIKGIEHGFKNHVKHVYADTISGLITLQFGNLATTGGSVAVYDPSLKGILWRTDINYGKTKVEQVNGLIIKSNLFLALGGHIIHDLRSGEILWETKSSIYYSDPKKLIGLTYANPKKKENSSTLVAVDLSSGKEIWSRRLNRDDEWSETLKLNDSVLAVVSSGLHVFNLNTGIGWSYDLVTNAKGTGKYVVSNIVLNNSKIYLASKESLVCLNESGKEIWKVALPAELMSKSHLYIKDNLLYLLNRGIVFQGPEQSVYGKPFFASYGLEDGRQKFFTETSKTDFINGMVMQSQSISLISGNSIMKYSLKDGHLLAQQSYDQKEQGSLRFFAGDLRFPAAQKLYIQTSDSSYHNLIHSDTTKQFVVTTNRKALILNDQLKIEGKISYADLYYNSGSLRKFKLLNNADEVFKTLILDQRNKPFAQIEASGDATLIGETVYDSNLKTFVVIDLSDVNKK